MPEVFFLQRVGFAHLDRAVCPCKSVEEKVTKTEGGWDDSCSRLARFGRHPTHMPSCHLCWCLNLSSFSTCFTACSMLVATDEICLLDRCGKVTTTSKRGEMGSLQAAADWEQRDSDSWQKKTCPHNIWSSQGKVEAKLQTQWWPLAPTPTFVIQNNQFYQMNCKAGCFLTSRIDLPRNRKVLRTSGLR